MCELMYKWVCLDVGFFPVQILRRFFPASICANAKATHGVCFQSKCSVIERFRVVKPFYDYP
jgi:hypothetical protein